MKTVVEYKDVSVGAVVKLGKILAEDSKAISEKIGTITVKSSGGCGGARFQIVVDGVAHKWRADNTFDIYLHNIKEIISTPVVK